MSSLIMKIPTTDRCVAVATLLFVFSGVAEAVEIYFPSFQRNSMVHFSNDTFVAEIPNPPEINGNFVCGDYPCVGTRSMTLGPDGKFYISSITTTKDDGSTDSSQGVVMVFDPSTDTFDPDPFVTGIGNPGSPWTGPTGIAFGGPNNDIYVTGGEFGGAYVRGYDGKTGAPLAANPFKPLVLGGLNKEPNNMIATPDGDLLVAGGGGTIRRVNPVTGDISVFAALPGAEGMDEGTRVKGMVFSPDGNTFYAGTDNGGLGDPNNDAVIRFDVATGDRITDAPDPFVPAGHDGTTTNYPTNNIEGLVFSPDGSTLFVGSLGLAGKPAANAIYRVDPNTGEFLDGFDQEGVIIPYIRDISTTTSQGGPGDGLPMSPMRVITLVPEPSSLLLIGIGVLLALFGHGRRQLAC